MNPAVKTKVGHSTGYEIMPGATAKSLMTADDPVQKLGALVRPPGYSSEPTAHNVSTTAPRDSG